MSLETLKITFRICLHLIIQILNHNKSLLSLSLSLSSMPHSNVVRSLSRCFGVAAGPSDFRVVVVAFIFLALSLSLNIFMALK